MSSVELGFNLRDQHRLSKALSQASEVRIFRRIQAVLLIAEGRSFAEAAQITALSLRSVYNLVNRYLQSHQVDSLHDLPHPGRPQAAACLTKARILRLLQRSPLRLGYRSTVWTVAILAQHLRQMYQCSISARTLRRRMKQIGLECKRPRYVYSEKDPHRAQKKGPLSAN